MADWDLDEGIVSIGDSGNCVSLSVADDVVLPRYFSFIDVMCDLSANIARVFKSIRRSLSPVDTGGGCGMVTSKSKSCRVSRWVGLFVICRWQ